MSSEWWTNKAQDAFDIGEQDLHPDSRMLLGLSNRKLWLTEQNQVCPNG